MFPSRRDPSNINLWQDYKEKQAYNFCPILSNQPGISRGKFLEASGNRQLDFYSPGSGKNIILEGDLPCR